MAANASGALIVLLAIGLWRALGPSRLGRLCAATLLATGTRHAKFQFTAITHTTVGR